MTPGELKGKLRNLMQVLDKLPEDADITMITISNSDQGRILLNPDGFDAVVEVFGLEVKEKDSLMDDWLWMDTVLDGVRLNKGGPRNDV